MNIYEPSKREVMMSCGHSETLDMMTTGKQLNIDLDYYARQGLCKKCWAKLRAEHAAAKASRTA